MRPEHPLYPEMCELLEQLCEGTISGAQLARLEKMVLSNAEAKRLYVSYIDLHGTLIWDAATAPANEGAMKRDETGSNLQVELPEMRTVSAAIRRERGRGGRLVRTVLACAAACAMLVTAWVFRPRGNGKQNDIAKGNETEQKNETRKGAPKGRGGPVELESLKNKGTEVAANEKSQNGTGESTSVGNTSQDGNSGNSNREIAGGTVEAVNAFLAEEWTAHGIEPSERASDAEWLRRLSLDLVGHIPPAAIVEEFLNDESETKRLAIVERFLGDADFSRNWSVEWGNLLIGRTERGVDRGTLLKFLREQIHLNRPWNETVALLVGAEGRSDENGAANFLLAHLNNDAVPATAITSQLFLGIDVQCTQCHRHPTNNWTQDQFWELNSFFQQTEVASHEEGDRTVLELVTRKRGGPIHFENRTGLMQVAYPVFAGKKVDPGEEVNRRRELARLMQEDSMRMVARAYVNRMWEHFFGYGFTRPVDDMGPHNPPSNPDVLERLTKDFVASGYDTRELIRWITRTDAYQRSSEYGPKNDDDAPEEGETPLFSRMYVKPLTPDQLHDSLLVATEAQRASEAYWSQKAERRQAWLEQFYLAQPTEENCELPRLDGAMSQTLALMNGELVNAALSGAPGTFLHQVATQVGTEDSKIQRLSLAALGRFPSNEELAAQKKQLRSAIRQYVEQGEEVDKAGALALQDLFWAYLNSAEFAVNH